MTEAFIYDALRTPRGRGKASGSLHATKPVSLVVGLIDELRKRNPELDPDKLEDVVLGCVSPIGDQGGDIAKTAAIAAGLPDHVGGVQLNRFCASGLEAVNQAGQRVRSGFEDLIVAGGVESMSRVPMASDGGAWAMDPETNFKTSFVPQGIGADLIATLEGFSREDVDAYALESQTRAAKSWADGAFDRSIVPGRRPQRPRSCSTATSTCARRRWRASPASSPRSPASATWAASTPWRCRSTTGSRPSTTSTTPATAPGIVDGAALVLLGHRGGRQAERPHPARPRSSATAVSGADPTIMLTGPTPACEKVLAKAGMTVDDIDLLEINEAFAAVPMKLMKDLGFPHERTNVAGGAIALGHPLGATGAMLDRHDGRRARAPRPAPRPGHAVHRRRHGRRHDHRARLSHPGTSPTSERGVSSAVSENMFRWEADGDGIVTLTMDDPTASANTMSAKWGEDFAATLDRLEAEKDSITGVVLTSAKKTFFAGGNLDDLVKYTKADAQKVFDQSQVDQGTAAAPRDPGQAGRRRDQRRRARRRPRDRAGDATTASPSTPRARRSGCPRSRSACCPAAAASCASCACSAWPTAS